MFNSFYKGSQTMTVRGKKIKISFNGLNIWGFMLSDACGVRKCMLREHSFASPGTKHWTWKSKYCV